MYQLNQLKKSFKLNDFNLLILMYEYNLQNLQLLHTSASLEQVLMRNLWINTLFFFSPNQ